MACIIEKKLGETFFLLQNCCSVVFCSKKCKDLANQTFHRIECQLKLYEMFEYESKEIFALFMALRAITQKPLHYFTENQKEIEKFLDLEEPTFPFPGRAYQSGDYRALCNLMTHVGDIDPDVAMKNSVLSVFFLRFIQKTGYFSKISGTGDVIYELYTSPFILFVYLYIFLTETTPHQQLQIYVSSSWNF